MCEEINQFFDLNHIEYAENVSLAKKTWIHRGPTVPLYITPSTVDELKNVVVFLCEKKKDFKVIGHTSNLYFKDTYCTNAIISTRKMTSYVEKEGQLICDAGVNVSQLAKQCVERGIMGFEGLVGLPGTVAAAVVNNSSCFKCSIFDLLIDVDALLIESDGTCSFRTIKRDELGFIHRSSAIKRGELNAIVLKVRLKVNKTSNIEELKQKSQNNIDLRKKTQEGKAYNLGSIFSGYRSIPIKMTDLGLKKAPQVFIFKLREHFKRNDAKYKLKRNAYLLTLFGYKDIIPYVSKKNINCFMWLDEGADRAFGRYYEFMHRYADCNPLEIEVLE